MSSMIPAWIFFDVGWTLVDETAANMAYYELALAAAPAAGAETPRSLFGRHEALMAAGEADPFTCVLESIGLTAADRRRFDASQVREKPYRDTEPALRALSGVIKLGVLANQPAGLDERLARVGLARYFDLVLGSTESGLKKPDPRFFELAATKTGCAPGELMMAGDRLDNDIAPAKALGWRTAWVRRHPHATPTPRDARETPELELSNLRKLAALFVSEERLRLAELTDADGAILAWPDKEADKGLVLAHLASRFTPGRDYGEPEVNSLIEAHHRFGDYALLRREMIVRGMLSRDAYGRAYRRAET